MHARPLRYVDGLPRPDRALVMGVLNVTPDSFSDGGRFLQPSRAVAQGLAMAAAGADLVDVGGESTRPGAVRPSPEEEAGRVLRVVEALAREGVPVSVDTMRASVAEQAVEAGAVLVNDVSGGRADADMLPLVARLGTPYVLMHWRAHAQQMQQLASYDDVVTDVAAELAQQLAVALAAGIAPERIAVDPGIGFSKTADQNWQVLAGLDRLHALGHPVLVATSRKRFLGVLLAEGPSSTDGPDGPDGPDGESGRRLRPADARDDATAATSALAAAAGAWCVRVHEVGSTLDAVRVAARWASARPGSRGSARG